MGWPHPLLLCLRGYDSCLKALPHLGKRYTFFKDKLKYHLFCETLIDLVKEKLTPTHWFQQMAEDSLRYLILWLLMVLSRLPWWLKSKESSCQCSRCWEDPLEMVMATHSSILAWEIQWTEEPRGLQSMGSQRVRHSSATQEQWHLKDLSPIRNYTLWGKISPSFFLPFCIS